MASMQDQATAQTSSTGTAAAGGKEDFLDKGLDSVEKKFGGQYGSDPAKNRAVNEKVTDKARGMFEKATGKHVPDKVSN